jgi:hypothetical protein
MEPDTPSASMDVAADVLYCQSALPAQRGALQRAHGVATRRTALQRAARMRRGRARHICMRARRCGGGALHGRERSQQLAERDDGPACARTPVCVCVCVCVCVQACVPPDRFVVGPSRTDSSAASSFSCARTAV